MTYACDEDTLDDFRDVSLIVDGDLLQKAATIIDLRQIKRIVTGPGDRVFFEFAVALQVVVYSRKVERTMRFVSAFLITARVSGSCRICNPTNQFYS